MASPAPHAPAACTNLHAIDISFAHFTWGQIAILGVVQGITELLPISSTAHLRVIPAMLGWQDPGSAFSAAMQLASLLAVGFADLRYAAPRAVPTRQPAGVASATTSSAALSPRRRATYRCRRAACRS